MVGVEQWAWLRREHFVAGKSIKRLVRETGLSKNTVRRALRQRDAAAVSACSRGQGVLEPFKPEIHRLLRTIRSCPGCGFGSCWSRWGARRERRWWMTICGRCGRCSPGRSGRSSGRSIGRGALPVRCVAAARLRSRSGMVRPAAGGWWSRALAIPARVRGCWCSPRRPRICWPGSPDAWSGSGRCRGSWCGIGRPGSTVTAAARRTRSPRSVGSCGWGGGFASRPIRRPRARSSGCRGMRRRTSSPAGGLRTSSTSRNSSTAGLSRSTRGRTRRCGPDRSTGSSRSSR